MRYVEIRGQGGPEVLHMAEGPRPEPGPQEAIIRVIASSVNRPDVQQRRGLYPPPPGASPVPGLDIAGTVEAVGSEVTRLKPGDPVCALTNGGGYAEFCAVDVGQCMTIPEGLTFVEAASLPEAFFTAWNNVMWLGALAEGETLLVQGGTSGVGMAAIQMARALRGARVFATAGDEAKRQVCRDIGAEEALDYRGAWDDEIREMTGGEGVDVVLDAQAGPYTQRQLDLLRYDGRVVLIASHQGEFSEINIRQLVRRRQTLTGSTIRPQSAAYKARLARALENEVWPLLRTGAIRTRIHEVFAFDEVRAAHAVLDRNEQIGKVVLAVDAAAAETVPVKGAT